LQEEKMSSISIFHFHPPVSQTRFSVVGTLGPEEAGSERVCAIIISSKPFPALQKTQAPKDKAE